MQMTTPDVLSRVDQTPSVTHMIAAASSVGSASVDAVAGRHAGAGIGRSFADILSAQTTAAVTETTGTTPAPGQSFSDFMNHRRTQMGLDDDDAPKEGESTLSYLNRHKKATAANSASTAVTASGLKVTGVRQGQTAMEDLNKTKVVDEAADRHATAEKAAEGLVSNALILPILKQVRRSAFAQNDVFSGGNGEKAFGPEFDMQLSDRIAKSPRLGVKNALVARLEKHHGATPKTASTKTAVKTTGKLDVNG
jgi:Rod binding domain-containing protein